MPLTRQAMHEQGEHIHFGLWPQVKELNHLASRHYALEGRCFVVAVGARMKPSDLPSNFPEDLLPAMKTDDWILKGGSALFAPNGDCLTGPLDPEVDFAIFEIADLEMCTRERMALDTSGHYNRRDVFNFSVNRNRN